MRSQFQYLMSSATITLNQVFTQSARNFCPILTKYEFSRKTYGEVPNIKFHGNPFSRSRVYTCGQTDGRKAAYHFSRREHLWRFTVSGNNKKYWDLNARCLKLCTTLTASGFSREIFVKAADIKFHGNPSSGRGTDTYGQTNIPKLNKS